MTLNPSLLYLFRLRLPKHYFGTYLVPVLQSLVPFRLDYEFRQKDVQSSRPRLYLMFLNKYDRTSITPVSVPMCWNTGPSSICIPSPLTRYGLTYLIDFIYKET